MAKQIYNYEAFTNKKEELQRIRSKQVRSRRRQIAFLVLGILCLGILIYIIFNSRCEYYYYKNEEKTEDNGSVAYQAFASGYLKYSRNGIEYQKKLGKSEWNIALSYTHPFLVTSDSYAVLGDKGENTLLLFNKNGKVRQLTLQYPLVQATVSNQGIMEVILEGEDKNYIQVYGKDGKLIADMRSSLDGTGYPVTAAISPDGTQMAVSYCAVRGAQYQTSISFYDFSTQLQSDDVTLKGGFNYEETLIPKISFLDNNTVAAFGNNTTFFYNIKEKPKLKKKIRFKKQIQSVFEGENYVGYILDNTENPEQGKYELLLYNKKGRRKLKRVLDMNYDTISMYGKEIIATSDNECTIINQRGSILFQGELNGNSIQSIIPAKGWRTYQVVFHDKIVEMKLSFWKKGNS